MIRKATAQSRGANIEERRYIKWCKERQICAACGIEGDVIYHHCIGSSAKIKVCFETVLIGHFFGFGLCECCDSIVTRGSRRAFEAAFGKQSEIWLRVARDYPYDIPMNIISGISLYGRA